MSQKNVFSVRRGLGATRQSARGSVRRAGICISIDIENVKEDQPLFWDGIQ